MSTLYNANNQQAAGEFREHLPTANRRGERIWVFAKKPQGRLYNARTLVSWILLAIMFAGPFIFINGNPLLMFNVVDRKFSIFGQMFWPTDTFIFAVCMILFFIFIALFTAVFGRVWCGWVCPQTILMEMVFRKIEWLIEGDAMEQRRLAEGPWTAEKIGKRAMKFAVFFAVSFIIGNWLLMYIIGSNDWWTIVSDNPIHHRGGLAAMLAFTGIFFLIFARFREQACTFICPYGRFQSVLIDNESLIVSYDPKRGEKRARFNKNTPRDARISQGIGDCIDCRACVQVCPTGIDIRNGLQLECVHCTACIDACDHVMTKLNWPKGLIRYASQNGIETGRPFRFTPRLILYCAALIALTGLLSYLLLSRTDLQATKMLRTPGQLYQTLPDGSYQNVFLTKVRNKTHEPLPVSVRMAKPEGASATLAGPKEVPGERIIQYAVIVVVPEHLVNDDDPTIEVDLYSGDTKIQTLKSSFVAPDEDERNEDNDGEHDS